MSFAFGFGGDDIDDDSHGDASKQNERTKTQQLQPEERSAPIPLLHFTFPQTLESLPSQISYNMLSVTEQVRVLRRSLFDIRAQLMAEADSGNNNDHVLAGLDKGDLTSGVYEGGFKTWECAVDLAEFIITRQPFRSGGNWHVIELGAGSAIPSCVLLAQAMKSSSSSSHSQPRPHFAFTLCDYNEHVLKLCTAPNVLLNTTISQQPLAATEAEQDLDLESFDISRLMSDIESNSVTVNFIAGPWGVELAELALSLSSGPAPNLLVLASETIYAPGSLHAFVQTLQTFLLKSGAPSATILVAAKQVYFGVGGGVEEFRRVASQNGLAVDLVSQVPSGVGRVILSVRQLDASAHSI